MQYCMQYWIQILLNPKFFDLDFFDQIFFGTNVFEPKERQQKQQPQPQF